MSSSRPGARLSAGPLVRLVEARLWQLSSCRPTQVSHHAASTRPKRSSAADPRLTNERTRDTSFAAAPLAARRFAS